MSAGLPGVGLSGLFMILTALLMPVVEVGRVMIGHSDGSRWRSIGRQWSLAAGMVGAYVGLGFAVRAVVGSGSSRVNHAATDAAKVLPVGTSNGLGPLGLSLLVLALFLLGLLASAVLSSTTERAPRAGEHVADRTKVASGPARETGVDPVEVTTRPSVGRQPHHRKLRFRVHRPVHWSARRNWPARPGRGSRTSPGGTGSPRCGRVRSLP